VPVTAHPPGGGGVGEVADCDGPGPGAVVSTVTSSKVALAEEVTSPIRPEPNVPSLAWTTWVPSTRPVSVPPVTVSARVRHEVLLVTVPVASVVAVPPETRWSWAVPAPVTTSV
jgi:hypothetical protein